jgi:hypothetical protein
MRTTYAFVYTNTCVRACIGARVALIDACADADGLLAVEGGLAPGAHTLVSLSLDRHRSVYYFCVLTGVLAGTKGEGESLPSRRSVAITWYREYPIVYPLEYPIQYPLEYPLVYPLEYPIQYPSEYP